MPLRFAGLAFLKERMRQRFCDNFAPGILTAFRTCGYGADDGAHTSAPHGAGESHWCSSAGCGETREVRGCAANTGGNPTERKTGESRAAFGVDSILSAGDAANHRESAPRREADAVLGIREHLAGSDL